VGSDVLRGCTELSLALPEPARVDVEVAVSQKRSRRRCQPCTGTPISGAAARVPEDGTAFAYRNGGWVGVIAGIDPDPANLPAAASWAQRYWQDLHSSSAGGGYVNMMMEDDGRDRVRAAYRGNYERLVQVKRRYDPTNLFHINHNIPPF
jgi:FAD/FMN-containing dehydrogenase